VNEPAQPSVPVMEPVIPEVPNMAPIGMQPPVNEPVQLGEENLNIPAIDTELNINNSNPFYVQNNETNDIPKTSPIIESNNFNPVDNSIESKKNVVELPEIANEFVAPQPIIITDYTKQYDPIMPDTFNEVETKVDFKEIINAIRECSQKIEKYGYKIDVEEYDLSTLYQVVFKIEK